MEASEGGRLDHWVERPFRPERERREPNFHLIRYQNGVELLRDLNSGRYFTRRPWVELGPQVNELVPPPQGRSQRRMDARGVTAAPPRGHPIDRSTTDAHLRQNQSTETLDRLAPPSTPRSQVKSPPGPRAPSPAYPTPPRHPGGSIARIPDETLQDRTSSGSGPLWVPRRRQPFPGFNQIPPHRDIPFVVTNADVERSLLDLGRYLQPIPIIGNIAGIFVGIFRSLSRLISEGVEALDQLFEIRAILESLANALPVLMDPRPSVQRRVQRTIAEAVWAPLLNIRDDLEAAVRAADNGQQMESSARITEATIRVLDVITVVKGLIRSLQKLPGAVDELGEIASDLRTAARHVRGQTGQGIPLRENVTPEQWERIRRARGQAGSVNIETPPIWRRFAAQRRAREFIHQWHSARRLDDDEGTFDGLADIFERTQFGDHLARRAAAGELRTLVHYLEQRGVESVRIVPRSTTRTPDFLVTYRNPRSDASHGNRRWRTERVEVTALTTRDSTADGIRAAIRRKAGDRSQLTAELPSHTVPPEGAIVIVAPFPVDDIEHMARTAVTAMRPELRSWPHVRRIEIVSGDRLFRFTRDGGRHFFRLRDVE